LLISSTVNPVPFAITSKSKPKAFNLRAVSRLASALPSIIPSALPSAIPLAKPLVWQDLQSSHSRKQWFTIQRYKELNAYIFFRAFFV